MGREEGRDRVKMDSPAVYTKPGGGDYKHSPCCRDGILVDLQVVTGETLLNLCLCVCFCCQISVSERGVGLHLSN